MSAEERINQKIELTTRMQGGIKGFAIFRCMLFCGVYITWLKQLKLGKVSAMVGSILVIVVPIRFALVHSVFNLKAAQINIQHSLIWKLTIYVFELSYDAVRETKNIFSKKDEDTVQ